MVIKTSPKDDLNEYEPHSCCFDKKCQYLRLELRKKVGIHPVSMLTGWKNTEDILTGSLMITCLILIACTLKLKQVMRQKEFASDLHLEIVLKIE